MSGNPYFGSNSSKAFKEACETSIEEHVKRMNELHYSDEKPIINVRIRKKNRR